MRDQPRISGAQGAEFVAYSMKRHAAGSTSRIQAPVFSSDNDEFLFTALPVAVSSWVLESIGFRELVNSAVE